MISGTEIKREYFQVLGYKKVSFLKHSGQGLRSEGVTVMDDRIFYIR